MQLYQSALGRKGGGREERRREGHQAIAAGIERGVPAVVWDVHDTEWGVIVGYDDNAGGYNTLTCEGNAGSLPYELLGQNGVDVLSVVIPGDVNHRDRKVVIRNSLETAVRHARQQEWADRPEYQNGLEGFDLWALLFERWGMLIETGNASNIGVDIEAFARYYANHHFSARCYACDYLKTIADGDALLEGAARQYEMVAESLRPLWKQLVVSREEATSSSLRGMSERIREAKTVEEEGIRLIEAHLDEVQPDL